jgi:hypothetical protein
VIKFVGGQRRVSGENCVSLGSPKMVHIDVMEKYVP